MIVSFRKVSKPLGSKQDTRFPETQTASKGKYKTVNRKDNFSRPSLNSNISSVGGFLFTLPSCLFDMQKYLVKQLALSTNFVPKTSSVATIESFFAFTAGVHGSATMFAFFS